MTPMINDLIRAADRHEALSMTDGFDGGQRSARWLASQLADVKSFLIEDAQPSVQALITDHPTYVDSQSYMFSPAPRAWIEFRIPESELPDARLAYLITQTSHHRLDALAVLQKRRRGGFWLVNEIAAQNQGHAAGSEAWSFSFKSETDVNELHNHNLQGLLALINLPVGLRRVEVAGNRAKARALSAMTGGRGGLTYSRITLDHAVLDAGQGSAGAGAASQRRYHFCRSHNRTRQSGRVEHVRAHWRGNEVNGRVEARYFVRPIEAAA